jgi:hypothetical protein
MNFAKRLLMVFGAVALAAIVGTILTPKALHAVATAVQVVNDAAHPVPIEQTDDPARSAFLQVANCNFNNSSECRVDSIFAVPNTQIGVVEFISSECSINIGTQATLFVDYPGVDVNAGRIAVPFSSTETVNQTGFASIATSRSVRAYGGSANWDAIWITSVVQPQGNFCSLTMSGHFVNR